MPSKADSSPAARNNLANSDTNHLPNLPEGESYLFSSQILDTQNLGHHKNSEWIPQVNVAPDVKKAILSFEILQIYAGHSC